MRDQEDHKDALAQLRATLRSSWAPGVHALGLTVATVPSEGIRGAPFCEWALAQDRPEGPKRRAEFHAGRAAARTALSELGLPVGPLPRRNDGRILWPEGSTGSVSHSGGFVAALVGAAPPWRGLGIDLETRRVAHPRLAQRILHPAELDHYRGLHGEERCSWLLTVFSAKESIYKAVSAASGHRLSWQHACLAGPLDEGPVRARLDHPGAEEALGCQWLRGVVHRDESCLASAFAIGTSGITARSTPLRSQDPKS